MSKIEGFCFIRCGEFTRIDLTPLPHRSNSVSAASPLELGKIKQTALDVAAVSAAFLFVVLTAASIMGSILILLVG